MTIKVNNMELQIANIVNVMSPPSVLKRMTDNPRDWTVRETRTQLKKMDPKISDEALEILEVEEVDGEVLMETTKEELARLLKLGPATRISMLVKQIRKKEEKN